MANKVECNHLGDESLLGSNTRQLISEGKLILNGTDVCDWRFPIDIRECNGQNVSCVGPNSKDCPDPQSATIIETES